MVFVVGFIVVGLVLAIVAVFVFREAARMSEEPPEAVFDPDDAYDWVVRHLPDIVAATLTPADVRRILDFQLEFFRIKGVSGNGSSVEPQRAVIFGAAETIDYILERCAETGESYLPEQVEAVARVPAGLPAVHRRHRPRRHPDETGTTTRPAGGYWRQGPRCRCRSRVALASPRAVRQSRRLRARRGRVYLAFDRRLGDVLQFSVPEKGGGPYNA